MPFTNFQRPKDGAKYPQSEYSRLLATVEELANAVFSEPFEVEKGRGRTSIGLKIAQKIIRAEITTLPDQQDNPGIVLVRAYDKALASKLGEEFPVRTDKVKPSVVGTHIDIYCPKGGVPGSNYTPEDEEEPAQQVWWKEFPTFRGGRMFKTKSAGRAYPIQIIASDGSAESPPEGWEEGDDEYGEAQVLVPWQGHDVGEYVYALQSDTGTVFPGGTLPGPIGYSGFDVWIEIPTIDVSTAPDKAVLQVLDGVGHIGILFLRSIGGL
jgi:hypothetical protein